MVSHSAGGGTPLARGIPIDLVTVPIVRADALTGRARRPHRFRHHNVRQCRRHRARRRIAL